MDFQKLIREQGFAIIPNVLGRTDVDALLAELSQTELPRSKAGIRHALKLPAFAKIASSTPLLGIAREALGNEAIPFRATLFDKSPTANWLVVGTRIQHYHCASAERLPDGDPGR